MGHRSSGKGRGFAGSAAVLSSLAIAVAAATPASAAPSGWAPAGSAPVHPGVTTQTRDATCTANFVYTDGSSVYIGQAAHCSGTGGSTATNGCESPSLPLGTPVNVGGASKPGVMVYNSWLAMQQQRERDPNACTFNDFALVKLAPEDAAKVNPSVPFWGGPAPIANTTGTSAGDTVISYGNSPLRGGITQLSPKQGISLGDTGQGWNHGVATVTPGIPGDSGSGFMDDQGRALGVLSTLELAPVPTRNGVGDLGRELAYMYEHSSFDNVRLVPGTEPFRGPLP